MFTYTILLGHDPKYPADFHMSGKEFKSANAALTDALSWVNEDSLQDFIRILIYNKDDDVVMRLQVFGDVLYS